MEDNNEENPHKPKTFNKENGNKENTEDAEAPNMEDDNQEDNMTAIFIEESFEDRIATSNPISLEKGPQEVEDGAKEERDDSKPDNIEKDSKEKTVTLDMSGTENGFEEKITDVETRRTEEDLEDKSEELIVVHLEKDFGQPIIYIGDDYEDETRSTESRGILRRPRMREEMYERRDYEPSLDNIRVVSEEFERVLLVNPIIDEFNAMKISMDMVSFMIELGLPGLLPLEVLLLDMATKAIEDMLQYGK